MPAIVAIEVAAAQSDHTEYVASLVDACNAAFVDGACVYASGDIAAAQQTARVTWNTPSQATITFRDRVSRSQRQRTLKFDATDEAREKWRTVGFATALLAGGETPENQTDTAPTQPYPTADPFHVALTAQGVGVSGSAQNVPKFGAQVRVEGRAWQAPWLLGVSFEYAVVNWKMPGLEGTTSWSEVGAGAAVVWHPAKQLQLFTRVDVLAQRVALAASKKREREDAALWQPGARLSVDLVWPFHPRWFGVFGIHTTVVSAPVVLAAGNEPTQRIPVAAAGLSLGVQHRF